MRVGLHPAAFVQFHGGTDALGVGAATDRQQNDVSLQFLRGATLRRFNAQRDAVVAFARAGHLHAEAELHALPRQDALECLGDLTIHGGNNAIKEFHHRNFRAEPSPHAAEFQSDIAATDDHEMAGNLVEFQPAGGRHDLLLIDLYAGERNGFGACGDDDVLRVVAGAINVDLARFSDAAGALEPRHLVLAEQEFDAL